MALVGQQRFGNAEQYTDDAVLAAVSAHRAVVAVDGHRARVRPASIVAVSFWKSSRFGVARTISSATDNDSHGVATPVPVSVRCPTVSCHGPAQLRGCRRGSADDRAAVARHDVRRRRPGDHGGRASTAGDDHDAITEIGAVKVRGGEVLGELATLVDPGRSIPPQIVALTGITTAMVCDAPTIESVLPSFLEFSAARCWSPTMPASTSDSCARPRNAATSPGRGPRCCAQCGWHAGAHPRRGAQRATVGTGPAVQRRDHPDTPRPRRRPRHRRRAARADRARR